DLSFDGQAHRLGGALDGTHCCLDIRRIEVLHLLFGDLADLIARNAADLLAVRLAGALCDTRSLSEKVARGRRLRLESERAVRIDRDHDRDLHIRVVVLRLCVERLAELHDVDAVLSQRGADRRCRVGLTGRYLQLDVTFYLLCHFFRLTIPQKPAGMSSSIYSSSAKVTFSTSRKLNSYGVERPKIVIDTLSTALSSLTSSTLPVKLANGPDLMRTTSPT